MVKDYGKHVVNVAFEGKDGRLLPGGARRLSQATDWGLNIKYADLARHMRIVVQVPPTSAVPLSSRASPSEN